MVVAMIVVVFSQYGIGAEHFSILVYIGHMMQQPLECL
jgi:hypothetical protein